MWLHEQLWEKHYVRNQLFSGRAIRGEEVHNITDSGDMWRETMADFTILVICAVEHLPTTLIMHAYRCDHCRHCPATPT